MLVNQRIRHNKAQESEEPNMKWTDEHKSIRETAAKFVDNEINPYVDQWEAEGIFPAHELFKKLGDLGMLGINKPEK